MPEVKGVNDTTVMNFTIANNDGDFKDKETGEWQKRPVFIEASIWGVKDKRLEYFQKNLQKGTKVLIEGVCSARAFIGSDNNKAVGVLQITVADLEILELKKE